MLCIARVAICLCLIASVVKMESVTQDVIVPDMNSVQKVNNSRSSCRNCTKYGEVDVINENESRKTKRQNNWLMTLLPLIAAPFIMSVTMLPMMLLQIKFSLLQAMFLGKLAIFFAIINLIRNASQKGGVFSHNIDVKHPNYDSGNQDLMKEHYGYGGDEEYGAYFNHRKRRRK